MTIRLTTVLAVLALAACATKSDRYLAEEWVGAPGVRTALLFPANFDRTPANYLLQGTQMVTDEVGQRLLQSDIEVQRVAFEEVRHAARSTPDLSTAMEPEARRQGRRSSAARILAAKYGADLVVIPTVVIRDAKAKGDSFHWDGVSRVYRRVETQDNRGIPAHTGEQAGTSLHVVAYDTEGTMVFEDYAGLEAIQWLHIGGRLYDHGIREDLLQDPAIVRKAVTAAFDGFLPPVDELPVAMASYLVEVESTTWHRFSSGPLSMLTDVPLPRAQRFFEEIVRFLDAASWSLKSDIHKLGPTEVLLFADRELFTLLVADFVLGVASQGAEGATTALSVDSPRWNLPVLYHELIHAMLFQDASVAYPTWYHEGLAGYMSAALVRGQLVTVGMTPPEYEPLLKKANKREGFLTSSRLAASWVGRHLSEPVATTPIRGSLCSSSD